MRQIKDGQDVKRWREELRLSLREVGEQAGVDRTHLWSIEDGRVQPRKKTLAKIQGALEYFQNKQNSLTSPPPLIGNFLTNYPKIENQAKMQDAKLRGKAVEKFLKTLDEFDIKQQYKIIAAVLGFMDALQNLENLENDKIIGLMVEKYYYYIPTLRDENGNIIF